MIYWSAYNFVQHLHWIEKKRTQAAHAVKEAGRNAQVDGIENHLVTGERQMIDKCLENFSKDCSALKFSTTYQRAFELMVQVGNPHKPCYWSDIESGLQGIQWAVETELPLNTFVFIPSDKSQFFERDCEKALFGEKVYQNFKTARADIKEAGNCLAADLNTAAVFHLMSVVNIGLLALAKHLKLKIKAIEYQEWKNIIDGLKKKVDTLNQKSKGKKKQAELEFCHGLLLEFSGFKDVYRNNMAHARVHYKHEEAKGVHDRVRDFMLRLNNQLFHARKANAAREVTREIKKIDSILKGMKKTE